MAEVKAGQLWLAPTSDGAGEPFQVVRVKKDRAAIFWPRATPGWEYGHKRLTAFAKCRLVDSAGRDLLDVPVTTGGEE